MSGVGGAYAPLVMLYHITINTVPPVYLNVKSFGHLLDEGAQLMELDDIIALQLHFVSFLGDEVCCTAGNIEADFSDVFVGADSGDKLRVCGDHQRKVWWVCLV